MMHAEVKGGNQVSDFITSIVFLESGLFLNPEPGIPGVPPVLGLQVHSYAWLSSLYECSEPNSGHHACVTSSLTH